MKWLRVLPYIGAIVGGLVGWFYLSNELLSSLLCAMAGTIAFAFLGVLIAIVAALYETYKNE